MNFVSTEDFDVVPFSLPNIVGSKSAFDKYVARTQDEQLRAIFGTYFYDLIVAAMDALPQVFAVKTAYLTGTQVCYGNNIFQALQDVDNTNVTAPVVGMVWQLVEADNRWLLLKNGSTYMYVDRQYRWEGMKESMKGLVYALWSKDKYNDTLTSSGNVQSKNENSVAVAMAKRQVRGYNYFVNRFIGKLGCWPFYDAWHLQDSLYGYLWVSTVYDDLFVGTLYTGMQHYLQVMFVAPQRLNEFGI